MALDPRTLEPGELYANAPCGLMVTETNGAIVSANATLGRWLGRTPEQLMAPARLADLLTIGGRLFHQTHLGPLLQMQGSVAEVQLELRHTDGSKLPVLTSIARVAGPDGQLRDEYAFMVSADRRKYEQELLLARQRSDLALAERRQALEAVQQKEAELRALNAQLRQADSRKDEFLAVLAHELRNPLTPMRSGIDLLKMTRVEHPILAKTLAVFDRQVTFMSALVEDLMDVSRIANGKLQIKQEPIRVSELVQRAVELAMPLYKKAGQELHVLPEGDAMIWGDIVRLTQMLGNLLNNASKYTPHGGTCWLSFRSDGANIRITVRDNGIGIPGDKLDKVFAMFAQIDSSAGRAQGGIGIGLALVKGIVVLHGGAIHADSDGPGKGSVFTVTLPRAA